MLPVSVTQVKKSRHRKRNCSSQLIVGTPALFCCPILEIFKVFVLWNRIQNISIYIGKMDKRRRKFVNYFSPFKLQTIACDSLLNYFGEKCSCITDVGGVEQVQPFLTKFFSQLPKTLLHQLVDEATACLDNPSKGNNVLNLSTVNSAKSLWILLFLN